MEKKEILRITNELYRLTLFFPKKEPLRYKMRELADEILAFFLSKENFSNRDSTQILQKLEILDGFFEIVRFQNWVKQPDILNLQKEYQNLKEKIKTPSFLSSTFKPKNENKEILKPQKPNSEISSLAEIRQKKILQILKEKGKVQVWEIKEVFPQISKRTLRRDFVNLLKKGLVERVGEKNVTFYRLKINQIKITQI